MIDWKPPSNNAEHAARELLSAVMYLHTTFKDEVWLWRGQANEEYRLEPGMHTRVMATPGLRNDETNVAYITQSLAQNARGLDLDKMRGARLPDLALLAHLQHYGAATPLLDVSVDPLVALWMVAFASADASHELDDVGGRLYAIKRPPQSRVISPLDARPYWSTTEPSVASSLEDNVWWFKPPDVTERLRIQRGSFLVGPLADPNGSVTTLPLVTTKSGKNWLEDRFDKRGSRGKPSGSYTDVAVFSVRASLKKHLRHLLEERSGLDIATVYPTPWERPFIEQFAKGYGRSRPVDLP